MNFSAPEKNAALDLWAEGKTARVIADTLVSQGCNDEINEVNIKHMVCNARKYGDTRAMLHGKAKGGGRESNWPDEAVALLREQWGHGPTAQQIAESLSSLSNHARKFTRHAVIGKAHRLHLSKFSNPITIARMGGKIRGARRAARAEYEVIRARVASCVVIAKPVAEPPLLSTARNIPLLALETGDCRFPIGDPHKPEFAFCGCPQWNGLAYCEYHARLCYQPNSTVLEKRRAERALRRMAQEVPFS